MKKYIYRPHGVCSREISFSIAGDTVHDISFQMGCSGNTQGVSALAEGMPVDQVINLLSGINCNGRGTSCPAQFAKALQAAKDGSLLPKE